ncbi:MAG: ExbD/TolR family protein [Lewinella sp.]|jgi:biopolymer transport protein ExbD|uniref:ExbD/TolR family protein n=1 Tax=Lewinella TaxID=70994 RepID=UPI0003612BD6|nr:biopolymer transporter ExbD [Lewinella cohaerens]
MGFKKKNKVSAEFSMSSLTDIIFLLLIFFMLTSNFVRIQPFDLPQSDSKTVAPVSIVVSITKDGAYMVDDQDVRQSDLVGVIRTKVRGINDKEHTAITIVAEVGTDFEKVTEILGIAAALKVQAILATQPRS